MNKDFDGVSDDNKTLEGAMPATVTTKKLRKQLQHKCNNTATLAMSYAPGVALNTVTKRGEKTENRREQSKAFLCRQRQFAELQVEWKTKCWDWLG